jgi:RNA polymerase sigma-70 factor (ECF subfamily)
MGQEPGQGADRSKASARAEDMAVLMVAVAGRDRTAFAGLFAYYAPRVKSYLRRQRADERMAEDLVQDVMLTVWRKAGLFDPAKASVGTWIFTIARNRFIDAMRRQNRPVLDPHDPALLPEAPASADAGVASAEIGARVRDAMTGLPADQAEVVTLSFLEGLPHSEIADKLAIPLGTVKSRLRLAFARLRPALEDLR